jgi:hypothetical protein
MQGFAPARFAVHRALYCLAQNSHYAKRAGGQVKEFETD